MATTDPFTAEQAVQIREALLSELPEQTAGEVPKHFLVLPRSHVRALDPATPLVVGGRGIGKSTLHQALARGDARDLLPSERSGRMQLDDVAIVSGFAEGLEPGRRPSRDEIAAAFAAGVGPRELWRAVLVMTTADALEVRLHPFHFDQSRLGISQHRSTRSPFGGRSMDRRTRRGGHVPTTHGPRALRRARQASRRLARPPSGDQRPPRPTR